MISLVTPTISGMPVPPQPAPSPPLSSTSKNPRPGPRSGSRSDTLFTEPSEHHRWDDRAMYMGLAGGAGMGMFGIGSAAMGARASVSNTLGACQASVNSATQRVTQTVDVGMRQGLPAILEAAENTKSSAQNFSLAIKIIIVLMVLFLLLEIYKINTNRKRYYY